MLRPKFIGLTRGAAPRVLTACGAIWAVHGYVYAPLSPTFLMGFKLLYIYNFIHSKVAKQKQKQLKWKITTAHAFVNSDTPCECIYRPNFKSVYTCSMLGMMLKHDRPYNRMWSRAYLTFRPFHKISFGTFRSNYTVFMDAIFQGSQSEQIQIFPLGSLQCSPDPLAGAGGGLADHSTRILRASHLHTHILLNGATEPVVVNRHV